MLKNIEKIIQNNNLNVSEKHNSVPEQQKAGINIKSTKEMTLEI